MQRHGPKGLIQLVQETVSSLWLECETGTWEGGIAGATEISSTLCNQDHDLFYRKISRLKTGGTNMMTATKGGPEKKKPKKSQIVETFETEINR